MWIYNRHPSKGNSIEEECQWVVADLYAFSREDGRISFTERYIVQTNPGNEIPFYSADAQIGVENGLVVGKNIALQ